MALLVKRADSQGANVCESPSGRAMRPQVLHHKGDPTDYRGWQPKKKNKGQKRKLWWAAKRGFGVPDKGEQKGLVEWPQDAPRKPTQPTEPPPRPHRASVGPFVSPFVPPAARQLGARRGRGHNQEGGEILPPRRSNVDLLAAL